MIAAVMARIIGATVVVWSVALLTAAETVTATGSRLGGLAPKLSQGKVEQMRSASDMDITMLKSVLTAGRYQVSPDAYENQRDASRAGSGLQDPSRCTRCSDKDADTDANKDSKVIILYFINVFLFLILVILLGIIASYSYLLLFIYNTRALSYRLFRHDTPVVGGK